MKINFTILIVLMLLSSSVIKAQKTGSVLGTKTTTVKSSETTKSSNDMKPSYQQEIFQVSEGATESNGNNEQWKLQENKTQSDKARIARTKITEALRKRLKKRNQKKSTNSELLESRKKRAAFILKNRVLEDSRDLVKKEAKQNQ